MNARIQRMVLAVAAVGFFLLLVHGFDHLVGREIPEMGETATIRYMTPACYENVSAQEKAVSRWSETRKFSTVSSQPVCFADRDVQLPRDSNGNIIEGRRSYMRLLYQVFSFSDGFS